MRSWQNRRFRSLLLLIAGVPIGLAYLWRGIAQPLLFSAYQGDFQESYMRAAGRIAAGYDPYDLCRTMGCLEPTGPQYVMPPALAWLLQPFIATDERLISIAIIVLLNLALAVFLYFVLRVLHVHDWQLAVLLVLLAIAFEPVIGNIDEGQINLVLLALSGIWLQAWVTDRWWGGVPLGLAVAIKLIQAPTALLLVWGRRWRMLAAAVVAGLVLWIAAAPRFLFEYLMQVLPSVSQGTGLFENHSPGGTITRLFEPATFLGAASGSPPAARALTLAVALASLAITFLVLRAPAPSTKPAGRALEAAAIVAVTPMLTSYSWGTHLVLLLLPILVLAAWAVPRRDWAVIALVAAGWLLIGPGHKWLQTLLVSHYTNLLVLRLMAEFGVVGVVTIWVASLVAVRRERSLAVAAYSGPAENQTAGARDVSRYAVVDN